MTTTLLSTPLGNWRVRRGSVLITMLICAVIILRFTFWKTDPATPATELIYGAYALWASTLSAYVFGVIVDDRDKRRHRRDSYERDSFDTDDEPSSPRAI